MSLWHFELWHFELLVLGSGSSQTYVLVMILGWPKSSFRFFHTMLQKTRTNFLANQILLGAKFLYSPWWNQVKNESIESSHDRRKELSQFWILEQFLTMPDLGENLCAWGVWWGMRENPRQRQEQNVAIEGVCGQLLGVSHCPVVFGYFTRLGSWEAPCFGKIIP